MPVRLRHQYKAPPRTALAVVPTCFGAPPACSRLPSQFARLQFQRALLSGWLYYESNAMKKSVAVRLTVVAAVGITVRALVIRLPIVAPQPPASGTM